MFYFSFLSKGGNSEISGKWKKEFLPEHCVISVEIFDPTTNTWTMGPDLPNAICGAGRQAKYCYCAFQNYCQINAKCIR